DHEDRPERLAPAREVGAAEDVGEDREEQPDPDEEQEEPDHRPEHLAGSELCEQRQHLRGRLPDLAHSGGRSGGATPPPCGWKRVKTDRRTRRYLYVDRASPQPTYGRR